MSGGTPGVNGRQDVTRGGTAAMDGTRLCSECGVPLLVSRDHTWHANGVIAHNKDPDNRLVLYESDNLNALYDGIGKIIGLDIDKIVIESKRPETRRYVERQVSPLVRLAARHLATDKVIKNLSETGRVFGFGDVGLVDKRRKGDSGDFVTMSIRNPHSLLSFCGEVLGAWEAIDGRDHDVTREKVGEREYHVTCRPGGHPVELQEHLQLITYPRKAGNLVYDRCTTCGVPREVGRLEWDLGEGTITDPETGRRMGLLGVLGVDTLMADLEAVLGEAVPQAVIEAQRQLIKAGMKEARALGGASGEATDYQMLLAVRGLGNLTGIEMDGGAYRLTIQSSCLHLPMVGIIQAIVEVITDSDSSTYQFERSPGGDLTVTVSAA
jgi:hypothetical protein